ncbi:hypothetical protein GCM10009096_28030 [Parasphingorhabdus litoris]|uniref:DUF3617 family protein n=1 Tax=Parasphingorhabdus litoris TaxID=394733 RepID=A0ABN1AU63_9SPHN|nr:hypothetical protein [Parasphingorhabdus litoris]
MRKALLTAPFLPVLLVACGEEAKNEPAEQEKLTAYQALGTEPGWTVEIKDDQIIHTSQEGNNDFSLAVQRMEKTATGWNIKGFTDKDNITVTITSGEECNDGMSDRVYADTVKVSVSGSGHHNGCGGEILSDPEAT